MEAFDYVVVGGGTAGCVLAARVVAGSGRPLRVHQHTVLAIAERAASLLTGEQAVPS